MVSRNDANKSVLAVARVRQTSRQDLHANPAGLKALATKSFGPIECSRTSALLGLLGIIAFCSGSAGHADSRGVLGGTSKASIGISVSIRPLVNFSPAQVQAAAQPVVGIAASGNGQLCLTTNMAPGRLAVSLGSGNENSPPEEIVIDAEPRLGCALAQSYGSSATAMALTLPAAIATSRQLVQLVIAPD